MHRDVEQSHRFDRDAFVVVVIDFVRHELRVPDRTRRFIGLRDLHQTVRLPKIVPAQPARGLLEEQVHVLVEPPWVSAPEVVALLVQVRLQPALLPPLLQKAVAQHHRRHRAPAELLRGLRRETDRKIELGRFRRGRSGGARSCRCCTSCSCTTCGQLVVFPERGDPVQKCFHRGGGGSAVGARKEVHVLGFGLRQELAQQHDLLRAQRIRLLPLQHNVVDVVLDGVILPMNVLLLTVSAKGAAKGRRRRTDCELRPSSSGLLQETTLRSLRASIGCAESGLMGADRYVKRPQLACASCSRATLKLLSQHRVASQRRKHAVRKSGSAPRRSGCSLERHQDFLIVRRFLED
mmetsp:Transcript_14640/g.36559  ORF Transcript_14640/g.36559 Transcript_14640/m.36559 type:complete len:350 (-) Transcript_14640:1140-2189(-)